MKYLLEEDLIREIKKSKKLNKLTEELKTYFVILIENLLESSQFKNYDEETKDIMKVRAYEFLSLYWNNFEKEKIVFYINSDRESIKELLRIDPKKIRVTDNNKIKVSVSLKEAKRIEKLLKDNNIQYEKEKATPKAFAYFTQIAKSAFLQTIKKSNFSHVIKTDSNNEINIIQIKPEDKEYFKFNSPTDELIKEEEKEELNLSLFNKIVEKIEKEKEKTSLRKKEGCISIREIHDINPILKILLEELDNFNDFIKILSFLYDEKEIKMKDIISNPTILFILKKISS